jgi:XRE family transcriptional regulator, regulator of sulfur utilization
MADPAMKIFFPMKNPIRFAVLAAFCSLIAMSTADSALPPPPTAKLLSTVFDWEKLAVEKTANGVRRAVLDGPTTTLDKLHVHITTLNPGQNSGEPRRHLQEEVIIVKEGLVEAHVDGRTQIAGPGSVFFFAANAVTRLRNAGPGPATYTVVYYYTPLTPKE